MERTSYSVTIARRNGNIRSDRAWIEKKEEHGYENSGVPDLHGHVSIEKAWVMEQHHVQQNVNTGLNPKRGDRA